jgi:riboflavin synthase
MFTGIIESLGTIKKIYPKENIYKIKTNLNLKDCNVGSSICCDGVCLTAIDIIKDDLEYMFSVNIGEETINRSNLSNWNLGYNINLEKSLKLGDEISGHFVYGHVDTTLNIEKIKLLDNSWEFEFSFSNISNSLDLKKYIVEKGSVAINGISLTIANTFANSFNVSIIPHTFQNTNLSMLKVKDRVNIEFDPLARYIRNRYDN